MMVTFNIVNGPPQQNEIKMQLSPLMSIYELKRLVLYLVGNKPFFFSKNMDNNDKLQELIVTEDHQASIDVFLNFEEFNL